MKKKKRKYLCGMGVTDCNPAGWGLYTASDIQGAATSLLAFIGNEIVMNDAIRFNVMLQKASDNMSSTVY
jgi:hypothetical protein